MAEPVVFPGDPQESLALAAAAQHHCACVYDQQTGLRTGTCGPHQLFSDPATLRRLVFDRRIAARLKEEEGIGDE